MKIPEKAIDILQTIARLANQVGRKRRYLEARLLETLAHDMLGNEFEAFDVLKSALKIASADKMVRLIIDEGIKIKNITRRLEQRGDIIDINPNFIARILEKNTIVVQDNKPFESDLNPKEASLEISDFSEKECSILQLVAQGKSNVMISERLEITTHTVKWHLGNIYTKLKVRNRAAAVSVAKAIQLI